MADLGSLFEPETIAVVGASDDPSKFGNRVMRSVLEGGFQGEVFPVNPTAEFILDRRAYRSVKDIPRRIDAAFMVVPARIALEAIQDAVAASVRGIVTITAGFGETGQEGKALERQIAEICLAADIPMVGPNCMGVCCFPRHFVGSMSMAELKSDPGVVSFISQSGTYGLTTLSYAVRRGVTFNKFVSSGNEAVTHFSDYLEYLGADPGTNVIMGYIESIKDGAKFLRVASEVARKKPVVVMKFGRTRAGTRAASSHTGALAGAHAVYEGCFRQCGVVEVRRTQDLLNAAKAFMSQPLLCGKRIGVVGASGGFAVAATDFLEEQGLEVPEFTADTQRRLREESRTVPYASLKNPIDLAADLRPEPLLACAEIVTSDDTIDGTIVALPSRPFPPAEDTIRRLEDMARRSAKPLLLCYYASPEGADTVQGMTSLLPVYASPEEVGQVMASLYAYGSFRSWIEAQSG